MDAALELPGDWPEWHRDALCAEPVYDPDWWFVERGLPAVKAKKVCARCAARTDCLAWALEFEGELPGIWGGTSTTERKALRMRAAAEAVSEAPLAI